MQFRAKENYKIYAIRGYYTNTWFKSMQIQNLILKNKNGNIRNVDPT